MSFLDDTVRTIEFRYDVIAREGTKLGEVECVKGEVSMHSLARIKSLANFVIREKEAKDIDFLNDLIAPYMITTNASGEKKEYPLGQYLMSSPERRLENKEVFRDITAYDMCQILAEDRLTKRLYLPMGSNYVDNITRLIHSAGIMRVHIDPSPAFTKRDREFELGEDRLSIVNQLLGEINYTSLFSEPNGRLRAKPYILPSMRSIEVIYQGDNYDLTTKDQVVDELDLFSVPNYWLVVVSNPDNQPLVSHHENNNPLSLTSTVSRKRRIVDFRQIEDIADQETLDSYTRRIATQNGVYQRVSFTTALNPAHWYGTSVFIDNEDLDISGKYIEQEWSMPLQAGAKMQHLARRSIYEF